MYKMMGKENSGKRSIRDYGLFEIVTTLNP